MKFLDTTIIIDFLKDNKEAVNKIKTVADGDLGTTTINVFEILFGIYKNSKNKELELIKRNNIEIVTEEELKKLLKDKKKPSVYCGYEPSGPMHLGHFVTITKLMDFEKTGFKVKILLADIHAFLNRKGSEKD